MNLFYRSHQADFFIYLHFLLVPWYLSLLSGCLPGIQSKSSIIARVNDRYITSQDFQEELAEFHLHQLKSGRKGADHLDIHSFLDKVIDRILFIQEARRAGFDRKIEFRLLRQEALQKPPSRYGKDTERYLRKYEEAMLYQSFLQALYKSRVQISNREIEQYYHDNLSRFEKETMILLEHICLKDLDSARKLHQEILEGADPAFLVKVTPSDENIRYKKEWMLLQNMKPELKALLDTLKDGEISPLFHHEKGYSLYRVNKKIPGSLLPLEKVKGRIRESLASQKFQAVQRDCAHLLRSLSEIVIYEDNLQKLIPHEHQPLGH
ncbi:MAG: peptidyl-prolyl cis-trans isomerase [bacterium]